MMDICKDTAKIALSQASVLISGESGTGKELIARAIHYNSRRAKGRSLKSTARRCRNRCSKVNCLVMKKVHLLVHKPCVRDYLNVPTKVLCSSTKLAKCRWYCKPNYYAFCRNGNLNGLAASDHKVDIRIIAATNRDLQAMVKEGTFREDLFIALTLFI